MKFIRKTRREWFGGVAYSENPGCTLFVDAAAADSLNIPPAENLSTGLFSAPLDVHISITNRCNLRCHGCYARDSKSPDADMPLKTAKRILDRLSALHVFTVALGGGEPFLHPDLFDIARYAREQDIVPNITTNGLCIDASMAKLCRVFGSIHVSCHSPEELPRLSETVRLLRAERIDPGLNVLVSARSYPFLAEIWAWCRQNGVSRILVQKFKLTEKNRECEDMVLPVDAEQALLPLIRRLSRKNRILPIVDCSLFPAIAFHAFSKRQLDFFDVNGCQGGNAFLAVTTDGRFKPCSFCSNDCGEAGSLDKTAWFDNKELQAFRRFRGHEQCNSCTYKDLCNGGCRLAKTPWCLQKPRSRRNIVQALIAWTRTQR